MFINRLFKKSGKIVSLLLGLTMLLATFAPGSFAFNYNGDGTGSGNKPINCNGYSYTHSTKTLKIFFSKQSSTTSEIVQSQFAVRKQGNASDESIYSFTKNSGTGYSGVSDTNLNKGTTVTIVFTNELDHNALYDVTIKAATLADDNLITLGNYRNRSDFTFTFRTPLDVNPANDNAFSDSVAPVVTYLVGTSNVPYEPNVGVIFDRPLNATSAGSGSGGLLSLTDTTYGLTSNFKKGLNTVVYDDVIDANSVTGAECYKPFANTAATTFFFPETVQGNTNTCYNRDSSAGTHSYTLDVPPVTDISGNSWTHAQLGTLSFDSESYDQVGWLDNRPTFTNIGTDSVTVNWNASGITGASTPAANRYDLYMSANTEWDPADYSTVATDLSSTSYTKTGLTSDTTYYFRVVPKYSGTPAYPVAGFSVAGTVTTN